MKPNIKKWMKLTVIILLIGAITFTTIVSLSQPGLFGQATSIAVKPTISSSTSLRPNMIDPAKGEPNRLINGKAHICYNMFMIRLIGIPGDQKPLKRHARETSRSFYPLGIPPVIGVMSCKKRDLNY